MLEIQFYLLFQSFLKHKVIKQKVPFLVCIQFQFEKVLFHRFILKSSLLSFKLAPLSVPLPPRDGIVRGVIRYANLVMSRGGVATGIKMVFKH